MGLAEVQSALARLYTDRPLREGFSVDPVSVGRELGLTAEEAAQVAQVSSAQVGSFAQSLVAKRCGEVEKLLPLTRRTLGRPFVDEFSRFAAVPIPNGVQRHREDALAFARFLEEIGHTAEPEAPWLGDLLRYEAAWLQASSPGRRWLMRCFRHPVGAVVRHLTEKEAIPPVPARRTLGVWLRLGRRGPLRHWLLP